MTNYYTFSTTCKSLGLLLLVLLYLSSWGTENSYGMALAVPESSIENIITSSGLTTHEETLFRDMIEGIVSNTKKSWYSEDFSPEERSSYKDAVDLKEILKIQNLVDSSMEVVKMVDARLKEIVAEKRRKMGRWAAQEKMEEIPYRISINNPNLVLEVEKYDCLGNKGASLPSNETTDVSDSIWLQYSDRVYVPFKCPIIQDFDLTQALKDLQKLVARTSRAKRNVPNNLQVNIIQVNLTITSETFDKTLLNVLSGDYNTLTNRLTTVIDAALNTSSDYKGVNDFSYRKGSVIATFHVEITGSNSAVAVRQSLWTEITSGMLGDFTVNASLLAVGQVVDDNGVYSPWTTWSSCTKTCGTGEQVRRRSCNSTVPLACAHEGLSVETRSCYSEYCSNECKKVFTDDRGNFSSPRLNGKYPAKAECVWQIKVDENHTIVVEFEEFDLEEDKKCLFDYVGFYDGAFPDPSSHSNKLLMRFCGNSTPPRAHPPYGYPINSSDSAMTVKFKTDSTKERKGFTAIWYKVLKFHLRRSNVVPQSVTTLSLIYNPWSTTKAAAIPVGRATTCPESLGDKDCYFYGKQNVISRVISVYLNRDLPIESSDPVFVNFEHILDEDLFPHSYTGRKTCVTWDHSITSPRFGAWTRRGCYSSFSNLTHTFCKCLHTGVFAVLGEEEVPPKDLHLKANVYLGVAVSLIFIILTVQTLATKTKINTGEFFHLFETLVSGVLVVIFLTGAHVPAEKELCGFLAFFLYYLVLSQFTWMLLTVIWIQNLLKRYLSERVKINFVYFILGWGVPLVLAGVAGKVDIDQHGNKDNVCWVSIAGVGTVWGYGAPVFAMLLVNIAVFVFLLLPRAKEYYDCQKLRPRILKEILIMFFFLMTWVSGVRVILDDSFKNQYFFCFFLILQGAVNYNFCIETTEQFWKDENAKAEKELEKDENSETSQDVESEEKPEGEEEANVMQQPRMTVKTLKNLNIYKENGVFVIEA